MSWNPNMEVQYMNSSYPYNTAGSFMEYVEGLTYEHVNFIFSGASHSQESIYPQMNTSFYKFGLSDSGSVSYYDRAQDYEVRDHEHTIYDHRRPQNSSTLTSEQRSAAIADWEESTNTNTQGSRVEC